jgi:hypothetical protein
VGLVLLSLSLSLSIPSYLFLLFTSLYSSSLLQVVLHHFSIQRSWKKRNNKRNPIFIIFLSSFVSPSRQGAAVPYINVAAKLDPIVIQ